MKALGHPSYSSHPSQPNFPSHPSDPVTSVILDNPVILVTPVISVISVTLVILGHSQKSEVAGWTKTKQDIFRNEICVLCIMFSI